MAKHDPPSCRRPRRVARHTRTVPGREPRQLLLASALAVLLQNELARFWAGPTALAGYLVLLLCGLILVLQPVPGRASGNQTV